MARLASSLGQLKAHYDVVVVGSGYGGAVAASRLAEAGFRVCVLERGREFGRGDFPGNPTQALKQVQVDFSRAHVGRRSGLFDFRVNDSVSVLVGCGLGGTSLINANVMVKPRPSRFETDPWPCALQRDVSDGLEVAYRKAHQMLAGTAYPEPARSDPNWRQSLFSSLCKPDSFPRLGKLTTLRRAAGRGRVTLPLLTVSFATGVNEFGIQRKACVLCGDCVSGCNHGAKNTLDTNYLAHARLCGAEIFCGAEVRYIERPKDPDNQGRRDDGGWNVWFHPDGLGRRGRHTNGELFVHANLVVLAAGTLGSTDILLRSRARGDVVVSDALGHRFTGNGDVLAFGYNYDPRVRRARRGGRRRSRARLHVNGVGNGNRRIRPLEPVGPTITGMLDERDEQNMLIQEGAIPGALAPVLRWIAPLVARVSGRDTDTGVYDRVRELGRELQTLVMGARRGALANSQTYLVMTREANTGQIIRRKDRVRVLWKGVGHQPVFEEVQRRLRELTNNAGGTHVLNPIWTRMAGKRLLTVHPLGGCAMAECAKHGVVNHRGQVFRVRQGDTPYDDLLVLDGSIIPAPLGANPLWTIAALAERACALLVADLPPALKASAEERTRSATLKTSYSRPNGTSPRRHDIRGLRFPDGMSGRIQLDASGHSSGFTFQLLIEADDLAAFVREPETDRPEVDADGNVIGPHEARAYGFARAPVLSPDPIAITESSFVLFAVDKDYVDTRAMRYRLNLRTTDGRRFRLEGTKRMHGFEAPRKAIAALFRLKVTLYEETGGTQRAVGHGELRVPAKELIRSIVGLRTIHPHRPSDRLFGPLRFMRYFAGVIVQTSLWPFRSAQPVDPDVVRPAGQLRVPILHDRSVQPDDVFLTTKDGAKILLTRYRGGKNGPVILAPGFGTSTLLYRIPTIKPNLVEFLVEHEYDVWLLDYRASDRSASSRRQFDLDDIVDYDLPTAFEHVCRTTHQPDVQYIGHCVASVAMFMALLQGDIKGVRSAICSQFFPIVVMPWQNRAKASLRIAELLHVGGFAPVLTPDFDRHRPIQSRFIDRLLYFYPSRERCRSPVCRRTLFLYGETHQHRVLNRDTHDAVFEMFDRANLRSFRHLTRMCRHRRAVDSEGNDRYLTPENGKNLDLFITLMQGERNNLFLPEGARRMHAWLLRNGAFGEGPDGLDLRKKAYGEGPLTIPDFGHMDTFMGRDSAKKVFPTILKALRDGDKFATDHPPSRQVL